MSVATVAARFVRSLAKGAELASMRFPVAFVLVIVFSVLANAEVADVALIPRETLGWWFAAIYAAAAASVFAKLALEAKRARWIASQGASVAAALIVGAVVRFAEPLGIFAPVLVAAISFAVPLAPFLSGRDDRRFWTFTLWTGVGMALGFVSVLLFTLGLMAILQMIRFLFEIGLGWRAYQHIYATALTLVGPLVALGRIPADFDESIATTGEDRMTAGVRLLFDRVAAPLALATGVILHLYAAKILMLGTLPRNEVGWIVTSFALLVLTLRIGADPCLASGRFFARLFARVWALMLVVPLGLLAIALVSRVAPEGWTLERYYLALGALATASIVVLQIVPISRGRIRLIAAIPLTLLGLSSFGPLGVGDTVGRSQTEKLRALVVQSEDAASILEGRRSEPRTRIAALAEVNELSRAIDLLPVDRRSAVAEEIVSQGSETESFGNARAEGIVAAALGVGFTADVGPGRGRSFFATSQTPFVVSGYDAVVPSRSVLPGSLETSSPDGIAMSIEGMDLAIQIGGRADRFPLRATIDAVPAEAFGRDVVQAPPIDIVIESVAGRRVRLVLQSLSLDGANQPQALSASLLLRLQDWPDAILFGGSAEAGVGEPDGAIGQSPR